MGSLISRRWHVHAEPWPFFFLRKLLPKACIYTHANFMSAMAHAIKMTCTVGLSNLLDTSDKLDKHGCPLNRCYSTHWSNTTLRYISHLLDKLATFLRCIRLVHLTSSFSISNCVQITVCEILKTASYSPKQPFAGNNTHRSWSCFGSRAWESDVTRPGIEHRVTRMSACSELPLCLCCVHAFQPCDHVALFPAAYTLLLWLAH